MSRLILASKSPRRRELLAMLGLAFDTVTPAVDESSVKADSPALLTERLSRLKAEAVRRALPGDPRPIVAADTLVDLDGLILGKPRSEDEARAMLRRLSGQTHFVHTGLTLIAGGRTESAVESAAVRFRALGDDEIEAYLTTGEPMDKAGAYGIQGRAGAFIDRIEGDYYAVVGLPICRLTVMLKAAGFSLSDFSE